MYQEHVETPAVVEQKTLKQRWIEALRSGRYKQCHGVLRRGDRFCALGVLADVEDSTRWSPWFKDTECFEWGAGSGLSACPSKDVMRSVGVSAMYVYELNDILGRSFEQIADWIEENT